MKYATNSLVIIYVVSALAGCSTMMAPSTSEPEEKVAYAYQLFDVQMRPLPAEKLLKDAIEAYKQQGNELGLAEAYRAYGTFFQSPVLEKWRRHYKQNGFLDKTATYDNRYDKSAEYFEKSARLFAKNKNYHMLTNVYLNMGLSYESAYENDRACKAYRKSLSANHQFMKNHPDARVPLPQGFVGDYDDYINGFLKRLKCE